MSGPSHDAWQGLTRDAEFAVWRTMWLARWARMEVEMDRLRGELADVRAELKWTRTCHEVADREGCIFNESGPDSVGVGDPVGHVCTGGGECICYTFCSEACSQQYWSTYRHIPQAIQLREIPVKVRCNHCRVSTNRPWMHDSSLRDVRRRYWPADMPVPPDTPKHLR